MKNGYKIALVTILAFIFISGIAVVLLIKHANRILKYELENMLGNVFSVNEITLTWGVVLGSEGAKQVGKGLKGFGESFLHIFK